MAAKPILYRVDQRSEAWKRLHLGRPTASNFHKILTPGGKASTQARKYMCRLIAEKLLNEHLPERANPEEEPLYWLDRGIDMEPIAVQAFQNQTGLPFEPIGFVTTADHKLGCSPDGLVTGAQQACEIKSPAPWTQMKYLLDGPGTDYKPQVQGQLIIGQFECIHFYSFHPRMPPKYLVVEPEVKYAATLKQALDDFLGELEEATLKAQDMGIFVTLEMLAADSPAMGELGSRVQG